MSRVGLIILLIVLALIVLSIVWPLVFGVPRTEAPTATPDRAFKGPTSTPYITGPSGPPPVQ
ncbi:MAG: hypothetical protein UY23_C0001G0264 [Candidatus Jorgensenbacteria bacterium GW2011_GWA1_48_11]|uniref:Uncharacterized protein n=1 Tax=Candidatus Jorgensenbacteria bacterium GW2011_GWA1_48_11 TaxID=1618660 RepID=A0A0G1WMV2_9BACT|nr:MAG: hypothetical protein UY23_C0001G0264 [Candidatus Jorgensenbacteria bacterium GW2011_GWA1_48_11]KKW12150.1 MAG: hypothetical protein UY51_C0005G0392 [Candidatus Jorgensenbacteria bacterium GW2011_GWB1_49_9]